MVIRPPHFINTPGYVYAYAYGQLLALAVYGRYEEEGAGLRPGLPGAAARPAAPRSPEELGQIVGIDLADPGFWDRGLDLVERQLEAAEARRARIRPRLSGARRSRAAMMRPSGDELVDPHALVDRVRELDPVVPTMTVGIPRAQNRRMSAPHGHAGDRRGAALGRDRRAHARDPGMGRIGLARRERAAGPGDLDRRSSASAARTAASSAARAAAGSSPTRTPSAPLEDQPVGHRARPLARVTRPTETG